MTKLLRNPKFMMSIVVIGVLFAIGLAGGALGNEFGGGFIGSSIPHLQLAAEPVISGELFPGFVLTNTMVATWLTILVLTILSFFATRNMKEIPGGLQNVFEVILEFFLNLAESIAGPEKARRFFPLVMTIFIFIMTANWLGVFPGFGTIGRVESPEEIIHHTLEGDQGYDLADIKLQVFDGDGSLALVKFGTISDVVTAKEWEHDGIEKGKQVGRLAPFLRSANTDINTTLAIALVAPERLQFCAC